VKCKKSGKRNPWRRKTGVAFPRFRVRDFRNLEGKEQGHFGVVNPKIPKEACGHGLGGRIGRKFAFRHFGISGIGGSRRQRFSTSGLRKSRNPKSHFGKRSRSCLKAVVRVKGPVD
jgi:hypothetical protein